MRKEQKIKYITIIIVMAFTASVFYHYVKGVYWGMGYPYNTFLSDPRTRFGDFFLFGFVGCDLDPYFGKTFYHSPYFPFANVLNYFFLSMPPMISFSLLIAVCVLSFVYFNMVNLKTGSIADDVLSVFVFSVMTYPFLLVFDRMNLELLVFIFLAYFVYFYCKERLFISLIFLSFAIAMKLFPAVFLVLLLADKKYRGAVLTIILTLALTYACLLFHKGGFWKNLDYIVHDLGKDNFGWFLNNDNSAPRGVSLFTFFKIILIETKKIGKINMGKFLSSYVRCMMIAFAALSAYIRFVEKELWKKVALLVFAMLLFPHVSFDYKLIHVFIPLWLFINCPVDSKLDKFYTIMFAVLLIPKEYYLLPGIRSIAGDNTLAVMINVVIMLAMMLVIVVSGVAQRKEIGAGGVVR